LSWWPSQNYLDILGWPRHVPPFGHGVRTPVSSSQSHLSNALLLRLVSAAHCPSDTPAAHPGVIVGSRYVTPFYHARSLHGVLMFVSMYSTTCSLGPLSFGFLLLAGDPHLEVGLIPQGGVLVMAWLGSCLWRFCVALRQWGRHTCVVAPVSAIYPTPFNSAWSRFFRSFVVGRLANS
jgi:hypothetical protein